MGYKHLAPMDRPHYPKHSKETSERREARAREKRIAMMHRKGKRK